MTRTVTKCAATVSTLIILGACRSPADHLGVREEDVRFQNDSVSLAGTLVLPDTAGPAPAVVLVQGSGPETRRHYLRYAREFASAGIAALAYDKRGAGESSAGNPRSPFDMLAGDVLAAVSFLKRHPAIDSTRIGLWGLSEGEWVAPLAANRMERPAFLILASASSLTPTDQVRLEMRNRLDAKGYPDSIIALADALHRGIAAFQRDGSGRDSMNAALERVAEERWFEDADALDARLPEYERVLQLPWFPAWRTNMDFDALLVLRRVKAPLLVLLGGMDPNNDHRLAAARYRELTRADSSRIVDVLVFPKAEHAMVEWWLPLRLPPPRYPDGYFNAQVNWMRNQLGRKGSTSFIP